MIKFPYVIEYKLFKQEEVRIAEELLSEYNDFFMYNQSQYNDNFKKLPTPQTQDNENIVEEPEESGDEEKRQKLVEANSKACAEHFSRLFGSKDFGSSAMVGLKIAWYDLQQILLEEFRTKTPAAMSAMNYIAPRLRNLASILLFAEYVISKLDKLSEKEKADQEQFEKTTLRVKSLFEELLGRLESDPDITIPEFAKSKNALAKMKKPEDIVEFCSKLAIGS